MFVDELSGCGFESCCCPLHFFAGFELACIQNKYQTAYVSDSFFHVIFSHATTMHTMKTPNFLRVSALSFHSRALLDLICSTKVYVLWFSLYGS